MDYRSRAFEHDVTSSPPRAEATIIKLFSLKTRTATWKDTRLTLVDAFAEAGANVAIRYNSKRAEKATVGMAQKYRVLFGEPKS